MRKARWHSLSLRVSREQILLQMLDVWLRFAVCEAVKEDWKIALHLTSTYPKVTISQAFTWLPEKAARKSKVSGHLRSVRSPSFLSRRILSLSFSCMQCTNFLFRLSLWEKFPSKWKLDAISLYPLSFLSLNLSDPIFERNFPSTTTCGWMPNSYLVCMRLAQSNQPRIRDRQWTSLKFCQCPGILLRLAGTIQYL